MKKITSIILLFLVSVLSVNASVMEDVATLQHAWAKANYSTQGKAQKAAFETLIEQANKLVKTSPDSAELLTWRGIINSTYAGVKGGLGAMKYAKNAKADLEKALQINDKVLAGSVYVSLGILYSKVPGWPIGFGDDDKAQQLLKKGLALNPNGIDSNYLYADFLVDQGSYKEAEKYLFKAQKAPARPERPIADKGRQKQITALLSKVQKKLKTKNSKKLF